MTVARFEGLDPDEHVITWMTMSFAGSAESSVRGAFPLGLGRVGLAAGPNAGIAHREMLRHVPRVPRGRRGAIALWALAANNCGFPVVGGDMVLGLSNQRRVHVWRPRFWLARPGAHAGWFPCTRIVQVAATRQFVTMSMTWLIDDGTMLGFESMHARRLRAFADALRDPQASR